MAPVDPLPPRLALLALELRAPTELAAVLPAWPVLRRAPAGDGHTVIVFPGLAAPDVTTLPLRRYLDTLGYRTQGWNLGLNFGPRPGVLERVRAGLTGAFGQGAGKVSLIGWSLGGLYARELAKELPDLVRCVVTLGSPFAASPRSTRAWRLYELASGRDIDDDMQHYRFAEAPPVPTTSIYSRSDGIVAWQGSIQQPAKNNAGSENIEVRASHLGLGVNPSAWWAIADRLAQPEGRWVPFSRMGLYGLKPLVYPDPTRAVSSRP